MCEIAPFCIDSLGYQGMLPKSIRMSSALRFQLEVQNLHLIVFGHLLKKAREELGKNQKSMNKECQLVPIDLPIGQPPQLNSISCSFKCFCSCFSCSSATVARTRSSDLEVKHKKHQFLQRSKTQQHPSWWPLRFQVPNAFFKKGKALRLKRS